jgi:hypothetical protein
MITRAQAEALLTLAESLEACGQLGLTVEVSPVAPVLIFRHRMGGFTMPLGDKHSEISPMLLRLRIAEEVHHSEA